MKQRIEKLLEVEKMTYSKFADEIGVQRSSISHVLSGRNKPSLDLITKILNRFTYINSNWLVTGKGEMNKKYQKNISDNEINNISNQAQAFISQENNKEQANNGKNIKKIVVFYTDDTYQEYFSTEKE